MNRIKIKGLPLLLAAGLMIATACRTDRKPEELTPLPMVPPAATDAAAEAPPQYNDYNLVLTVDPERRKVDAVEKVKYINKTGMELDRIYFNVYLNAFSRESTVTPYLEEYREKIFENGPDYSQVNISDVYRYNESLEYDLKDTLLQIQLKEALKPGEPLELTIAFEAYIPKINHRTGANDDSLWFGNFIPTLAVYDGFGWHRSAYYPLGDPFYTEISNFTATINTPAGYTTVTTGIENSKTTDNRTVTTVTTKLTRDFAFYVAKNVRLTEFNTGSSIDIHLYTREGTKIQEDEYLHIAAKALDYFSENVGAYPYAQLDLVECGLFAPVFKAYPEIVFMDTDRMQDSAALRSLVHAIGHQWFYNIIGNNGTKEAWLSEGFISCLQDFVLFEDKQALHQKMLDEYAELKVKLKAIENKTLLQDLSVYISGADYYNVQYVRGKLMVYALQRKLGTAKFAEFLKIYYNLYSFKNVNRDDFIRTAEEVYGNSLTNFFEGWMQNYDLPPL